MAPGISIVHGLAHRELKEATDITITNVTATDKAFDKNAAGAAQAKNLSHKEVPL